MFDLISRNAARPLRQRSPVSKIVALLVHVAIAVTVVVIPLVTATNVLPEVPTIVAFVAAPPPPAPPPPPPPPPAGARTVTPPVKMANTAEAPVEAPSVIEPERQSANPDAFAGVPGGVEGGVPGGVVGGIVGGIVSSAPLPPPPPPPPPPLPPPPAPVRVGGQLSAPALIRRVEPKYPDLALAAKMTGLVILEAQVGPDGCVESVKVLRAVNKLLDDAAVTALKQWQYSPLVLNGVPTPFVLTVTINFKLGS
jgi:periplasmic protein TonB